MTEREKRIEIAVKNPEQIAESPEEIAARDRLEKLLLEDTDARLKKEHSPNEPTR